MRWLRPSKEEAGVGNMNEYASPACSAHEVDHPYMWAPPQRRPGLLTWALHLVARRRHR